MASCSYLRMCTYNTAVPLKAASRFLPRHATQRPDAQAVLCQTGPMPRSPIFPSISQILSISTQLVLPERGPSLQIVWMWLRAHYFAMIVGWGWSVCTMLWRWCYSIVLQGPMCEARCGPRMQRMRPVFPLLHYVYVSQNVTHWLLWKCMGRTPFKAWIL